MEIRLIAVGRRMPDWVAAGYGEFARRLPRQLPLRLVELEASRARAAGDAARAANEEGAALLAAARGCHTVALDEKGKAMTTRGFADALSEWMMAGRDVAFLVGGADGLGRECRGAADRVWSLSGLTFPHQLVRVIVAEQVYRAWTLLNHHPYHRE